MLAAAQALPSPAPASSELEKRAAIPVCLAACTLACLSLPPPADLACEVSCLAFCLGSVETGGSIGSVDSAKGVIVAGNGDVIFTASST
ncbi:hypothetical protein VE04_04487 [Pseudogymnoascus sp. 24MN13]|nr:hypothetical protein VE04_04487 [Pseudogymnoascus sp. 24MN13]